MKIKITDKAFEGLSHLNGQTATLTETVGASGTTKLATLAAGGAVYLTPDQYTKLD